MTAGVARAADARELQALWGTCFSDTQAYIGTYFQGSFVPDDVFVLRETGICAMAISFAVGFIAADGDEQSGAYLYAVCVRPDCRGRGLCRKLLAYAERTLRERGAEFVCLKPGNDSLQAMYASMGYAPAFFHRETTVRRGDTVGIAKKIDAGRYFMLRELLLRGSFVSYPLQTLAHQQRLGTLLELQSGDSVACAAAEADDGQLVLKEFLGDVRCLDAALAYFHADTACVRTPGDETMFAMAKTLTGGSLPTGYLAFAFD